MKTMQNISFLSSRRNSGFTLIEFLVASALALIVISAAGSTYLITRKLSNSAQKRLDTQQNLRNALHVMHVIRARLVVIVLQLAVINLILMILLMQKKDLLLLQIMLMVVVSIAGLV